MYEIYCKLRDERKLSNYAVSKATGINQSTFSDWKSGRSVPKQEKLQKIADYFGVSLEYLMTGQIAAKESTSGTQYYFDDETAELAQELLLNQDLKALMSAGRKLSPENLRNLTQMINGFKETNPDG